MNNISLDLYNYFYYVCEFKSVTKAANFLYISQPAITKQIKKLEEILGKKLIERSTTGIELTPEGKLLYQEIKPSIEVLNGVEGKFREKSNLYTDTIKIVVGHSTAMKYVLPAMSIFNKKYPNIKFELSTFRYIEAIQMLREGKVDLIFLSYGEVKDKFSNINIEKFRDAQDIFVIRSEDKDKYPSKVNLLDLNDYKIICLDNKTITRSKIEDYYKENNKIFMPTYELSNNWMIEEYVKRGLGVGLVVKDLLQDRIDNGEFVELKTDIDLPIREVGYAYKNNSLKYKIIKELVSILKDIK